MRRGVVPFLTLLIATLPAAADLQSVEVGGEIRIRMRANLNYQPTAGEPLRVPYSNGALWGRPLGAAGVQSRFLFDDTGIDRYYVEQQTRLNVKANFTEDVAAFVEFDSSMDWGTAFRSDFVTGLDRPSDDGISVLQSYIEVENMFGQPLRLRAGRQTMNLGKGWLVGDRITGLLAFSYDAMRLTYNENDLTVDAWWSKLAENAGGDEDVDFYGVYGTWSGWENQNLSLYWMLVRDGATPEETDLPPIGEWLEEAFSVDDYGSTTLHTIGARYWGEWGAFDYDWELAYQFGDASRQGFGFAPVGGGYGDDSASFDNIGTDLELGYTFDVRWAPRLYLGGTWFEGQDNRDVSLLESLNPFRQGEASISFNRLFSDAAAKHFLILDGFQTMSNFQAIRLGVDFKPIEKLTVNLEVEQFWADEPFDRPVFPLLPLSFLTRESDKDLGLQFLFIARYNITPDLWLRIWVEHFLPGEGILDGNFTDRNGLRLLQGADDEYANYLEATIGLRF